MRNILEFFFLLNFTHCLETLSFYATLRLNERIMLVIFYLVSLLAISANGKTLPKKKGCVIGTGGAGLTMIKELAAHLDEFEPIAFEKKSDVGGLWIYTDRVDVDEHGLPVESPVYKNMRTNAAKQIMQYDDFQPIRGENRSCPKHETILEYLRNYTDHFDIRQYIQFDTLVEKVTPILGKGDWRTTKWRVRTKELTTNRTKVTICDAVMICTGRDRKPNIPKIPGMETFPGQTVHSVSYRTPEDFDNQTVVVLGAGASGQDIVMDLSSHSKKVYLSHRNDKIVGEWPDNIEQIRGVTSANGSELTLQDNSTIRADAFIYCTGYVYYIPVIDESSDIVVETKRVYPLYKHLVNARHPSMAIFGLPTGVILYFSIYYLQAKYYVTLLQGKVELPSLEERLKDAELPSGVPLEEAHELKQGQWAYYKELADAAGFEPLPDYYEEALNAWRANMLADPPYFKQSELRINNGKIKIAYPRGRGRFYQE